jgi:GNAT superfamily N-acetyltransferase
MGLLNALQAASNTAADTVAAPVDGLAWLLQRMGVPVNNPVGGSDWMRQRGLTAQVQPGASKVAGETFGLLAPTVAVTKAPQIAAGLLKMGENAAKPGMARMGQRGAINVEALRESFPDIDFWLKQSGDKAMLEKVVVPKDKRGSGLGSEFMGALVRAADEDGTRLGLTPSSDFGGSKARLIEFYKRFGFEPNKGRNRDFELMAGMVRQPKQTP